MLSTKGITEWQGGSKFERLPLPNGNYMAKATNVDILEREKDGSLYVEVDVIIQGNKAGLIETKIKADITGKMAWKGRSMMQALGNIDDSGKVKPPDTISEFLPTIVDSYFAVKVSEIPKKVNGVLTGEMSQYVDFIIDEELMTAFFAGNEEMPF